MNLLTDKEWLEINEIIKEIYACEDIKTLGYTFLSLIRNMVPFKIGSFSLLNEDTTVKVESAVTVGEEMISVEEYNEIYFESDFINDVMSYPKSVVFRDCDVVESQEKVKTFFYKNFMMMYNAEYYSGILLKKEGKLFACATFLRTSLHGQLKEKDVFIMETFIGHLENILCCFIDHEPVTVEDEYCNIPEYELLSKREREILRHVIDGETNKTISDKLYISESTVKKHVYNIFLKFNVKNRNELIRKFT